MIDDVLMQIHRYFKVAFLFILILNEYTLMMLSRETKLQWIHKRFFSLYIVLLFKFNFERKTFFYTFVFIVFAARTRDLTKPFSNSMYRFDYGITSTLIHCFLLPNAISLLSMNLSFFNPVNLFFSHLHT